MENLRGETNYINLQRKTTDEGGVLLLINGLLLLNLRK